MTRLSGTETMTPAVRNIRWGTLGFFTMVHLGGIIGAPIYLMQYGASPALWCLSLIYLVMSGISITFGYHRLYSHRAFHANKIVEFINLFFGAAAFEMSALGWSSQHRDHHQYVDTQLDPYNIKKGFFYAHMGWMLFWKHAEHYENVHDLKQNKLVVHQHQYYPLWSLGAGIAVPVLIGAAIGEPLGAFLIAVCARITTVYQCTFCINSVCHMFGKPTYDYHSTAKDHWFVAFLTWGEGFHNFHHRFPSDYRNGVRWFHYDPTKWAVALLEKIGWTSHIQRTSDFKIFHARLVSDHFRAQEYLQSQLAKAAKPQHIIQTGLDAVKVRYQQLMDLLHQWEKDLKHYKALCEQRTQSANDNIQAALQQVYEAKLRYKAAYQEWELFLKNSARAFQTTGAIA